MPELRIGVQLRSLKQPFKKALHIAARLGVTAVEIDARGELKPGELSQTALRQVRKMLADLNLKVAAVSFATRRGYDTLEDLEPRVEATKAAMKFAYDLGASVVINHVGRVPNVKDEPEWGLLVEVLTQLGHHGERVGALLAARTGSESGEKLAELLAALPAGNVGVDLDPANLIINGYSPLEAVRALGPHILHVHAKDAARDLAQGRGVHVPLGRGSTDFPALLGALEEHDYRGYFTVEREGAENPVAEIAQAIEYLKSL